MVPKDLTRLRKLNTMVNSINRLIDFGCAALRDETLEDLKDFRDRIKAEQSQILRKG